jgi:hypothetical protein
MRIEKSAFFTAALAAHGALGCGMVDEARKLIGKDRADAAPEAGPTVAAPPNLPPGIPPEYWAMLDAGSRPGVAPADAGVAKPKPPPPKRKPPPPQVEL